jgi:S1-C subfamily serine protease
VGIVYRFGGQARVGSQGRERPRQERASVSSKKPPSGILITQLGLIALAREGGGAEITEIAPGSIASFAGLRVGDIINAVDGTPVKTPIELESALTNREPGTKVKIGYMVRGYWQAQTEVTLK